MTENDKNFNGEINALLVAPVNGFDGEKISMLGLLYVTSIKDIFGRKNVDSIGAIADILGIAFSRIIPCLFARKTILIKDGIGRDRP